MSDIRFRPTLRVPVRFTAQQARQGVRRLAWRRNDPIPTRESPARPAPATAPGSASQKEQ